MCHHLPGFRHVRVLLLSNRCRLSQTQVDYPKAKAKPITKAHNDAEEIGLQTPEILKTQCRLAPKCISLKCFNKDSQKDPKSHDNPGEPFMAKITKSGDLAIPSLKPGSTATPVIQKLFDM